MKSFKPNLAAKADLALLRYPLLASPKLDGIRATVVGGKLLTRTLKDVPNKHIRAMLAHAELEGFDGELIAGEAWSKTVYRDTVSIVMSHDKEPTDLRFYCFDLWHMPARYKQRWHQLQHEATKLTDRPVDIVEQLIIENEKALLAYEEAALEKGFEGLILRDPDGLYKCGRSTVKEGGLLKMKRFEDGEARVIGVEEEMHNGNEAETNELGRTKRSTEKAGLVGKDTMGAIIVEDMVSKVRFNIGTGFTAEDRATIWTFREKFVGQLIKYKHFPIGTKDKPRHPVFLGMRDARDMS